jgi:hypothetical protein
LTLDAEAEAIQGKLKKRRKPGRILPDLAFGS